MKLAQGRKWKIVLFSKATANALSDKAVRDKVGMPYLSGTYRSRSRVFVFSPPDVIVSTPLRVVDSLQNDTLQLDK